MNLQVKIDKGKGGNEYSNEEKTTGSYEKRKNKKKKRKRRELTKIATGYHKKRRTG